ncbi:hypothetical protein CERZMDRAFT_88409 [Cercospora zeae-maydis SCOH1-5]|uniref:Uncharacterized protein n=1 Tax=Cercospora zeae-maydis SCOH1-5 TaxID=717836 RepID=A0A6A6F1B8_9PEZI|nr:hypothetical protein CERZMDRAFT_88409 [Cercospora zeae-maydis SCOH1-5]
MPASCAATAGNPIAACVGTLPGIVMVIRCGGAIFSHVRRLSTNLMHLTLRRHTKSQPKLGVALRILDAGLVLKRLDGYSWILSTEVHAAYSAIGGQGQYFFDVPPSEKGNNVQLDARFRADACAPGATPSVDVREDKSKWCTSQFLKVLNDGQNVKTDPNNGSWKTGRTRARDCMQCRTGAQSEAMVPLPMASVNMMPGAADVYHSYQTS